MAALTLMVGDAMARIEFEAAGDLHEINGKLERLPL
jgi:hypothetical protein